LKLELASPSWAVDISLFAMQRANAIARGASALCLGFSFALGTTNIDEEFRKQQRDLPKT
jgi:hypothetical protein